jgi:hypothetical protein
MAVRAVNAEATRRSTQSDGDGPTSVSINVLDRAAALPRDRRQGRSSTVDHQALLPAGRMGRGILSMTLAETQQLRMLERLRSAGNQPVTLDQLRAGGIDFPP